jgi:nucleotide-binding universal stress UspA family protein
LSEQRQIEARVYLDREATKLAAAKAFPVLLEGDPAERLMDFLEEKAIGLVVMTSHGRGGLSRFALGSVADRLIGGPAPVLIIPALG